MHTQDDTKTFRMFLNWTMSFNDALDSDKLHNSLSRLLNIGDWRKLGGRLRVKVWRKTLKYATFSELSTLAY